MNGYNNLNNMKNLENLSELIDQSLLETLTNDLCPSANPFIDLKRVRGFFYGFKLRSRVTITMFTSSISNTLKNTKIKRGDEYRSARNLVMCVVLLKMNDEQRDLVRRHVNTQPLTPESLSYDTNLRESLLTVNSLRCLRNYSDTPRFLTNLTAILEMIKKKDVTTHKVKHVKH